MNMHPQTSAVDSQVRAARERLGMTREQLAVKAGVSSSTVYLVERAGLMSKTTAAKLAVVLGVSAEELRP
ncbi:hypothetical protein AMPC_01070 [Anaeromyxobacter paludicola]|uniref:HTH cro/C1-type domain-containing protein n=1 Tax=Anaeromyxobacter paludicola TaxID=2918171 RepID=A0ABM7X5A2_9BACT|nr:hypothetical protein AMPC_01070 [Anaeromyxobacter paludicola]